MATDQKYVHFWLDEKLKRDFHTWCVRQGLSMSEVGRLVISALLSGRIALEQLETDTNKEKTDERPDQETR